MRLIFGPHTERVLKFLADLSLLSGTEIGRVTTAWNEASDTERAEAWAELHRAASGDDLYQILTAASVARRQAMGAARLLPRTDWAFWAAAWDAAAAIAAQERIGSGYEVLTGPLAAVMPSLSRDESGAPDAQVPAQRGGGRPGERRDEAGQSRASRAAAARHERRPTGKTGAGGR